MNKHHSVLSEIFCGNIFLGTKQNFRKFGRAVFRKFPKTVILGQNGHFLARWAKIGLNENFYKNWAVLFFTLIIPQLHAKFQKNRWGGFRDQFVMNGNPHIRTSGQG